MEKSFAATTDGPAAMVFAIMSDLGNYPSWLDVVTEAEPLAPAAGDDAPCWSVTLTAKVGPFARSKRLRMQRTDHRPPRPDGTEPGLVRFERRELDGRDHAPWDMEAVVADQPGGRAATTVTLRYGGGMWTGPLDLVLDAAADRAARRLADHVAAARPPA